MIPLPVTRGDEWRITNGTLLYAGEPVPNPDAYTMTGSIFWPGGSLPLNPGNGRIVYGGGKWTFVVQEADNLVVPLGRVARLKAIMVAPGAVTITSQSVTLEVRLPL